MNGTKRLYAAILIGATTGLMALPGIAQDDRGMRPAFSELDMDGDGQINRADLRGFADARFAAADTDSNGQLSSDELQARAAADQAERLERGVTRMINRRDADGDGALSLAEMTGDGDGMARILRRMDRDRDGAVSQQEYEQADARRGRDRGDKERRKN